jgi:ubiquinone biosynthesis accessory factor UbiJ
MAAAVGCWRVSSRFNKERHYLNPFLDVALAASNHLIKQADWAPRSLQPYAGALIQFNIVVGNNPTSTLVRITDAGYFEKAPRDAASGQAAVQPRAILTTPIKADLLGTWSRDGVAGLMREVRIEGDAELAATLGRLAKELRWDAEEDLSRLVGDIAAHRLANGAKDFFANAKKFMQEGRETFVRRAVSPEGSLIAENELAAFKAQLRVLRDDLDRLEQRVANVKAGTAN